MDAIGLTLAIFVCFWFIGSAFFAVFRPSLAQTELQLLAPAMGISLCLLPVFIVNRFGMPVETFGRPLFIGLLIAASVSFMLLKPRWDWRRLLFFFSVLLIALLLVAWPMLMFHWDWVSYGNDDMANYCLAAQRFLQHGYFELPNIQDLFSGRNNSLTYWVMHVAKGMRPGSELILAFWWAATGLNAHQLFMPVILALHLGLVSATGALVAFHDDRLKTILLAMGLIAISPLTTLGVLYQLIGQVGGLTLLCASLIFFCHGLKLDKVSKLLGTGVCGGIIFATLMIWYPEVLPFLGLTWFLYIGVKLYQKTDVKNIIIPSMVIGLMALLCIGPFLMTALHTMFSQATNFNPKLITATVVLFPYYQEPTGIPVLLGLLPLVGYRREPFVSLMILLGIFIFIWLMKHLLQQARKGYVHALMVFAMFGVGLYLFYCNNNFGLFKLAMFIQPFLAASIILSVLESSFRRKWLAIIVISFSVISACIYQFSYVSKSTGEYFGSVTEMPHASSHRMYQQLQKFFQSQRYTQYIADTPLVVLVKFISLYTQNVQVYYPSRHFFENIFDNNLWKLYPKQVKELITAKKLGDQKFVDAFQQANMKQNQHTQFSLHGVSNEFVNHSFPLNGNIPWIVTHHQTIFNSYHDNHLKNENDLEIVLHPKNHLVFIFSQLGPHYYSEGREKGVVAYSQLEGDSMFPGHYVSGLGRYLLFMTVGASERPRVIMELSSTVLKQFHSTLPKPSILGVEKRNMDFVGRGSGRIVSEPIEPVVLDGNAYIQLDMGREPLAFPIKKRGLSLLYGRNIQDDWRHLTTFGRDISLISEQEYQGMNAPQQLEHFPKDLANPSLLYSGIYEDGFLSEDSFFILEQKQSGDFLQIQGDVPYIGEPRYQRILRRILGRRMPGSAKVFNTKLTVRIDGAIVDQQALASGPFHIEIPIHDLPKGRHRVALSFDRMLQLPRGDERAVCAKLNYIGFREHA